MWQEVDQNNLAQLQTFVDVLKERSDRFQSAQQLKEWLETREVHLFYFPGPGYELAVAFRHYDSPDEWRVRWGGARGALGPAAGQEFAAKIVDFMRFKGIASIVVYSMARRATADDRAMVTMVVELLRQHPDVAEIRTHPSRIGRYYQAVLRTTP